MADLKLETVTDVLRDAFYVGVGAGVIAVQKLQVQRVELTKTLTSQIDEAKGSLDGVQEKVEDRVKLVEERLGDLENQLEAVLAQVEDKVPAQARDLIKQARGLVRVA